MCPLLLVVWFVAFWLPPEQHAHRRVPDNITDSDLPCFALLPPSIKQHKKARTSDPVF